MPTPRQQRQAPPNRPNSGPDLLRIKRAPAKDQAEAAHAPAEIPVRWFKRLIGVLLLPLCWMATAGLFGIFNEPGGRGLWHSEEVWMFSVGFLLWLLAFLFLPRPIGLYVVGHEHTHAIFVWLCGGRVGRIHSTSEGGYIVSDKNNFLISLSPYIVPFWTLVSLALLGSARFFIDIPWFDRMLFFSTGVTWSFHITFTIDMIWKGQPDIEENGRFFSLSLIYLCNILLIAVMLVVASPRVSQRDFFSRAAREGIEIFRTGRELVE